MSVLIANLKLMLKGIFSVFIICGAMCNSQGQVINGKHPSVYITFDGFEKMQAEVGYPSQAARFVLHNNTRWPIYYEKNYDPTVGAGSIIHALELPDGKREVETRTDVISEGKILPGKTLRFLVARRDFPAGSQIYIEFRFSWETTLERGPAEVVHRSYFLVDSLPPWPQK